MEMKMKQVKRFYSRKWGIKYE